jgi:hypothetical protein
LKQIEIEIIDTNNKFPIPEVDQYETVIKVLENVTSGYEIVQLISSDLDRDGKSNSISHFYVFH